MKNLIISFFKLRENNTTISREILAGFTTFITMSYIIFINPSILETAGMDTDGVFVATCLTAALGSFLTGMLSNYPIAVAPGMALNAYFAYVIVQSLGFSWQSALGAVFISGLIFVLLTVTKIRYWIVESIPHNLNIGISIGIGLFIILIALKDGGIVRSDPNMFMTLNSLTTLSAFLFFVGFGLIVMFDHFKVKGAILIGILLTTLLSILLRASAFKGVLALPPSIESTFFAFDLTELNSLVGFQVIFAFLLVALFDSTGTFVGVLQEKEFENDPKRTGRISRALLADSLATVTGSLLGTSSTSPFVESAAGIRAGGRTGLTAVTVSVLFLIALFFSNLAETIPGYALAPALFYVGLLMIKNIKQLDFEDFSEFIPGVLVMVMIPFSFSVADGFGIGIISYAIIKLLTGQAKKLNAMTIILSATFLAYFVFKP